MIIILSILLGLAIIAFGVVLRLYLNERVYHTFAVSAAHHLRLQAKKEKESREALEREMRVLRNANREANHAWQAERRRLWGERAHAVRHASELQEFHLYNEHDLQHELAGAHALIELLMEMLPKGYTPPLMTAEVMRVFAPVIAMDQHRPKKNTSNHPIVF